MENTQNIKDLIQKFYPHAKEKLGFDHPVRVIMRQDAENAKDSLGKTAYYDPAEKLIVLYVTDRHPKDILRSFSHELVHHAQNCRGDLDDLSTDGHYAGDGKGREIEAEAYLLGNGFLVRDWEDGMKHEGVNEMKLTKSQLKGIIEQTIEKITEKVENPGKYMGGARQKAGIDDDGDGVPNKADKSPKDGSVKEQEMVVKADVTIPPEGQRILDLFDSFLAQAEAEDVETQALVSAMLRKVKDKGVDVASPEVNVDEMNCGGKRDDELEEQEMQPTIKGKEIKIEKEPKFVKGKKDKEEPKKVAKPKAPKLEENNDTWYNSSLYESLKSKWTK